MRKSSIPVLAGTLTAAVVLTLATPGSAFASLYYTAYGWGTGTTSAAAKTAALDYLYEYNSLCQPPTLVYDTLQSGGYWEAEVTARCQQAGNQ
jgi:hypothetical protein